MTRQIICKARCTDGRTVTSFVDVDPQVAEDVIADENVRSLIYTRLRDLMFAETQKHKTSPVEVTRFGVVAVGESINGDWKELPIPAIKWPR